MSKLHDELVVLPRLEDCALHPANDKRLMLGVNLRDRILSALSDAEQEREACANVALSYGERCAAQGRDNDQYVKGAIAASEAIENEIRARGEEQRR